MKNLITFGLLSLLFLSSCTRDECTNTQTYLRYEPVFVQPTDFRIDIEIGEPKELTAPGKIYLYKEYIFINEPRIGLHVINNANPTNPVNEMFVEVPGNVDMAVMNDVLYLDSYTDLLAVDISDIRNPRLIERKEDIFTSFYHASSTGILSHYRKTDETRVVDCSNEQWGSRWWRGGVLEGDGSVFIQDSKSNAASYSSNSTGAPVQVGQGGSFARFTITHGYLYAISNTDLYAFPIQSNGGLGTLNKTHVSWNIETIFPLKDHLFIGSNNGLHIMGLEDPAAPMYISEFSHASACDPVVVQGDIAFVTLRNGNECRGFVNQLDVVNVRSVRYPRLMYSFPMEHPHGLAVEGDYLYLCEGKFGLKVFNIKDLSKIGQNLVQHKSNLHAWDAIAVSEKYLLVVGEDGLYQYDLSNPEKLQMLSVIKVKK